MTARDLCGEANAVLSALVAGEMSAERAATKLWTFADRDVEQCFPLLGDFRNLALTWDVLEENDPESFHRPTWRAELVGLARVVLSRGGIGRELVLEGDRLCTRAEMNDAPEGGPLPGVLIPPARNPRRPILFMDIDGVLALRGSGNDEPTFDIEADGFPVTIAAAASERLRRLREHFDLVWASSWMRAGAELLGPLLGLPDDLPSVRFDIGGDGASLTYKLAPIRAFVGDRRCAWVDDELGEDVVAWAHRREVPTLLVHTNPRVGLTDALVEELIVFADGSRR